MNDNRDSPINAHPVSEQAKALADQFSGLDPFLGSNLFGGQGLHTVPA